MKRKAIDMRIVAVSLLFCQSAICLAASRPQVLAHGREGGVSVSAILIQPREFTPERVRALSLEYWEEWKQEKFAKLSIFTSLDDWESTIYGPRDNRPYSYWTKRRASLLSTPVSYGEMIAMNGSAVLRYSVLGGKMVRVVLGGKDNLLFSLGGYQFEVVSVYASAGDSTPLGLYLNFFLKTTAPMEFGVGEETLNFMRRLVGVGNKKVDVTLRNDIWFQRTFQFPIAYRLYADQQLPPFEAHQRSPSIFCGVRRCSSTNEDGRGVLGPDFPTDR
jgi:hypothetical protein